MVSFVEKVGPEYGERSMLERIYWKGKFWV